MDLYGLFGGRTATLQTRLDAEAIAANLAAGMDSTFTMFGHMPVVGDVNLSRATVRKRIHYRNSFQTVVEAIYEPQGAGTLIRCKSRLHVLTLVVLGFWALGFVMISGNFVAAALAGRVEGGAWWILMPIAFAAFVFLMIWIGRWFARQEFDYLVVYIAEKTHAQVLDRSPA